MSEGDSIAITKNGRKANISPVVEAMVLLLLKADTRICELREGSLELHYVRATAKVSGKLKAHVGLERIPAREEEG